MVYGVIGVEGCVDGVSMEVSPKKETKRTVQNNVYKGMMPAGKAGGGGAGGGCKGARGYCIQSSVWSAPGSIEHFRQRGRDLDCLCEPTRHDYWVTSLIAPLRNPEEYSYSEVVDEVVRLLDTKVVLVQQETVRPIHTAIL
ncbi:hypothetical protein O988_08180 [Pseudogymnoascus sp. VKM F-3808]|nr:hypothetical protein O988_08180 [Pseudogymnoascus sp. VKM F-3808]